MVSRVPFDRTWLTYKPSVAVLQPPLVNSAYLCPRTEVVRCGRQVKEKAPKAADQVAGDMEQVAHNVAKEAVPAARNVGKEVEDGAQRLKKNAGPAADDAVAGARKARCPLPMRLLATACEVHFRSCMSVKHVCAVKQGKALNRRCVHQLAVPCALHVFSHSF